ncbi:glycosyltransferase family 2 protein [Lacrimispora saccharolytica]|uniref:glycosyltransferase family 2 protein n=1 Tax=Lacrimispora saccharolytica TaxID=84030 RepID=UPI00265CB077|nr:glycosyltransferase family 2 protein [Lacrimispora saccharolytica]MCF2655725.1 glycosyltransferase family 2 protein [Lacrimispora saccharolytica]
MKLLTIAIPSYNSENYLSKCIESLLPGGEDVEILVVNDGSKDNTSAIGHEYEAKYPGIVKVIDKENGGHGSAVNAGVEHATGLFFKVVDSDDWVKKSAYLEILEKLKDFAGSDVIIDMLISNFVYEKEGAAKKKVMRYAHALPKDTVFTWNDVGHFFKGQYILMHSVIYRTKLLRECGMKLPDHTFYVDNIFVYEPLPYVKNMYYMDVNFYRYYIGREDQSVNEKVMISRVDQQLRVNKLMIDYTVRNRKMIFANKRLKQYMLNYLEIITTISSIMLILADTEEALDKKTELWEYLKASDSYLYRKLRYGIMGNGMNLPGKGGRRISVEGYRLAQRFFKFN